jgi:CBS domain containing-hemolysin-like protein
MFSQAILLILLLLLSGFFSSAETALFSLSKTKARHLAKQKKSFMLIERMKDDSHNLLSTILIGNNIVNVGAAAMATSITIDINPNYAVGLATGIMTFLILVFGEVLPKSVATQNNILIARIVIYPIYCLAFLFYPIIKILNFIPKITGKIKKTPTATEEELMAFVEVVEEEGEIKEEEKELIHKIFEFDDTNTSEIMTPRADMFVIEVDEKLHLENIVNSGFTRIPVIEESFDNVIGIVNIKDLFLHKITTDSEIDVRKIMTKPYFIPENKKLDKLLHEFKERKNHMAIVVDEHGGVSGLITLEDALEEIVGEIRDETDREEPNIVERKDKEWTVAGKSHIDEVNEVIDMGIPDSKEYDTFSGYILNTIGRIPYEKEQITIGSYIIIVEEMEGNRIKEYSIRQQG